MISSQLFLTDEKEYTHTKEKKYFKVVVIGTRGFPDVQGGVETHCENLYPLLRKKGCRVFVFTRRPYTNYLLKRFRGVQLISLSCPKHKFLEAIVHSFTAVIKAKALNPDIIHIHAIGPSLLVPLAKILKMKVVVTHHGPDYLRQKWSGFPKHFLKFCERIGIRFADRVIVIEQSIASHLKRKYKRHSVVIPNGVIVPKPISTETSLRQYNLERGKYFLAVGRFVPEKGFHDLISAFKLYGSKSQCPSWKLVIVGDSDHKDDYSLKLKKTIQETPHVIATGFIKGQSLWELYQHCGSFVLPSYYEGLPIALLEAMSFGAPCLASNIAGNKSVPLGDQCYFEAGDTEELSLKLLRQTQMVFSKEDRNLQIDLIKYLFNWETIAQKTLDTYESLGI
jgi:glycosyltransferase involved in cell wall biosynthesis